MSELQKCLITGATRRTARERGGFHDFIVEEAGISYCATEPFWADLRDAPGRAEIDEAQMRRFAFWIRQKNMDGEEYPDLAQFFPGDARSNIAHTIRNLRRPTVEERIASYLLWAEATCNRDLGKKVDNTGYDFNPAGMIAACAMNEGDYLGFLLHLEKKGYLSVARFPEGTRKEEYWLTFEGMQHCEELRKKIAQSKKVFMAMWFDKGMDGLFEHLEKACKEELGFELIRIDRKEHNNKIDDEIIAELRDCRLVIADFTCADAGKAHRGGVYYEAGFARGLNKHVISTVRQDCVDNLHFDTRQFPHIIWDKQDGDFIIPDRDSKTLGQAVVERIRAIAAA
jgi:nucleoside 2-deoxyribosyltransferase